MKKQFKIHIKNPLLKNERCYCGQQTENLILYDKIKFIYFKRDIIPKNISRYCLKMYKREQSRLDNIRYFARDEKERLKKKEYLWLTFGIVLFVGRHTAHVLKIVY